MRAPGDRTPPSRHLGNGIPRPGGLSDDDAAGPVPSAAPSGPPSPRRAHATRRRGPPPRRVPARPFGRQGHRPPGRARACGRDVRRRRPPAPRTRCTAPGQPATGRAGRDVGRGDHNGPVSSEMPDVLARFSAPTRAWFTGASAAPTPAQTGAWSAIRAGEHALVVAPTGSGTTLAAFLWALDRLISEPAPENPAQRCRVLYVSPLKALAADVERNLRSPLVGIRQAAARLGLPVPEVVVGVRTGDTPPGERRAFGTRPPDVLITTPESLYLVLTSAARAGLSGVRTVILDEIHAVAGTKRGAHLALSLERLDALLEGGPGPAQRIGLSATVRPVENVARFLSGARPAHDGGRTVTIVQPPVAKQVEVQVVVPVPDLTDLTPPAAPSDAAPCTPLDARLHQLPARGGAAHRPDERGVGSAPGRGRTGPRHAVGRPGDRAVRDSGGHRHPGRERHPRARPPRVDEPGRADPDRDRAQVGPPAGGGGDVVPRAGHRHGCRRPGGPGRGAAVGRLRPGPPGRRHPCRC